MALPFHGGARGGKRGGGLKRGKPNRFGQRGVTGRKASPRNGGGFAQIDGGRMDHRPVKRRSGGARHAVNRLGGGDGGGNSKRQPRDRVLAWARQAASPRNSTARALKRQTINARRIDKETARAIGRNAQAV